ncbi:MAG: phospholipase D-like domain-containing protein [Pseudomonadota bacterium]
MPDKPPAENDIKDVQLLITAEEAYPAMERAFLGAKKEVWASFRVFDLSTRLRSKEARAFGTTWFDLIVHVLKRGVALNFALADFDPILAPELHCASWRSRRAFVAAREIAGPDTRLNVINATHSARVGLLPRLLLWPWLVRELARQARSLNAQPSDKRARTRECSPGLRRWLYELPGGTLKSRKWPPPPLVPGTHHQKMAVFDRQLLCIGGLDVDERRYDDKDHRRRRDETWHDVQLMCRGDVAQEAQQHLESFLPSVAGASEPPSCRLLKRTLSRRRRMQLPFLGPRPLVRELANAHESLISEAKHLIYLETQFFRDTNTARALARAASARPDLRLVVVLPGAPEDVAFLGNTSADARFGEYLQAKCVDMVSHAFGDRAIFCSPVRPLPAHGIGRDTLCGSPLIYVHAKVSIADDCKAIVSSANLNGRSLFWDTEAGIVLNRKEHVKKLRQRVFRHWLWSEAGEPHYTTMTAQQTWKELIHANAEAAPKDRNGFLVPYDPKPARAFGRPLPGVPNAMV